MAEKNRNSIRDILLREGPRPPISQKKRLAIIWGFLAGHVLLAVFVVLLIAVVGIYAVGALGLAIAESPAFCTMCHNMKVNYNSYLNSNHEGIKCAECHNEPGLKGFIKGEIIAPFKESYLYLTKNYKEHTGRPIVTHHHSESCLRHECHNTKRLEEETFVKHGIAFSHKGHLHSEHLEEKGIHVRCASCHATDDAYHMRVRPDICFVCHFNSDSGVVLPHDCAGCHADLDALAGPSYTHKNSGNKLCVDCHLIEQAKAEVSKESCKKCHEEYSSYEGLFGNTKLMHENHHYVRCRECHMDLKHEVFNIHTEDAPCERCHLEQTSMIAGEELGFGLGEMQVEDFADNHDGCISCHQWPEAEHSREQMKEICAECHVDDEDMEAMADIEAHEKRTSEALKEIEEKLEDLARLARLKNPQGAALETVVRMKAIAEKAVALIREDGSHSLHNKRKVEALIERVNKQIDESKSLLME